MIDSISKSNGLPMARTINARISVSGISRFDLSPMIDIRHRSAPSIATIVSQFPSHGDTELFADDACRAVGSNQIVGDDLVFLSGLDIAKRCHDVCAAFLKI